MPQMSPMMWTSMYLIFNLTLMLIIMMSFSTKSYTFKNETNSKVKLNNMKWMW